MHSLPAQCQEVSRVKDVLPGGSLYLSLAKDALTEALMTPDPQAVPTAGRKERRPQHTVFRG